MCYSYEASIRAWVINMVTSGILFLYNPILGVFFAYIGLMQAFDAWFWTFPNNEKVTKIAMIINILQPYVLYILVDKLPYWVHYLAAVYLGISGAYIFLNWNNIKNTEQSEWGSLYWAWNYQWGFLSLLVMYFILFYVVIFSAFDFPVSIIFAILLTITYIFSLTYYKGRVTGRFWCHWGAYIPLLFVLYYVIYGL